MVFAAHDVHDGKITVVDDAGERVQEGAILADQHRVVDDKILDAEFTDEGPRFIVYLQPTEAHFRPANGEDPA